MLLLNAADLYALACGMSNQGPARCYWCGAACERTCPHGDLPPTPFVKNYSGAKCPGEAYVCQGCQLFRRKRVTLPFLAEGFRDGQTTADHSWYLTEAGVWGLRDADHLTLYKKLLEPPRRFVLALKTADCRRTEIHLAAANDCPEIKANTPLSFTLNNKPQQYTVYDLETAIKQNNHVSPGVQALIRFLGKPPLLNRPNDKGRPAHLDGKVTQRLIRSDGRS